MKKILRDLEIDLAPFWVVSFWVVPFGKVGIQK